jgi:hypothetical protein
MMNQDFRAPQVPAQALGVDDVGWALLHLL